MNRNPLRHHSAFADVWAILRQPSTAWVTQQLLPHIQAADKRHGHMEAKQEKQEKCVLKH